MDTLSLYEWLGAAAFLLMIGSQVLAVLVLRKMLVEANPDADRKSADKSAAKPKIERPFGQGQAQPSRLIVFGAYRLSTERAGQCLARTLFGA